MPSGRNFTSIDFIGVETPDEGLTSEVNFLIILKISIKIDFGALQAFFSVFLFIIRLSDSLSMTRRAGFSLLGE